MTGRSLSRRRVLAFSGGAFALAYDGGLLRLAHAEGNPLPEGDAYAPWKLWNDATLRATPLALVSAAVLAANPHDTQPWLFRVGENSIELLADLSRNLGAMDPYVREMHLGFGCAIENMLLAAGPNGYDAQVEVADGSLTDLVERRRSILAATVRLSKRGAATAPDTLYSAIPDRHTNRYPYDRGRALPADWLEFARRVGVDDGVRVFLFADGEARRKFDSAVIEATQAIVDDPTMIADSDRWFRGSSQEIDAHRDGPTLDAAGLSFLTWTFAKVLPVSPEQSHEGWRSQTRMQVESAPLVGLIAVRNRYDRQSAIAAGRTWQRLHLSATVDGIAMQPLNQPIEMIDRERQSGRGADWSRRIADLTGEAWQATFSFRCGFASQSAPPSPRRRLRDVLIG